MYVLIYWKTDHIESVVEYSFRLTEIFILEKGGRQNMGDIPTRPQTDQIIPHTYIICLIREKCASNGNLLPWRDYILKLY